jgi:beta-1,4-mannosyl-glycoprotein beta-1,4-N-acetylglucosaminyltransferase
MFSDEYELLLLRIMTLKDIVDKFVVVEAGQTFTGLKRKRVFDQHPEFMSYEINYIFLEDLPFSSAWENEFYQRNQIMQGLSKASDDDLILISDVDEIPNPTALSMSDFAVYQQRLYYYYVNCLQDQLWQGTVSIRKRLIDTPQAVRNMRGSQVNVIPNGGWHYSFMGGSERIKTKLHSFSEQQVNTPDVNNEANIRRCLETGGDLFHRKEAEFQKQFTEVNDTDHEALIEWLKIYPYMAR